MCLCLDIRLGSIINGVDIIRKNPDVEYFQAYLKRHEFNRDGRRLKTANLVFNNCKPHSL